MTTEAPQDNGERVCEEVALAEFERFAEHWDLDLDEKGMDDEDRKGLHEGRRLFIRAMRRGWLVLNEETCEPTFTPQVEMKNGNIPKPVTFYAPTGATLMAADQKRKDHDITKMYAIIAQQTRTSLAALGTIDRRDLKYIEAIAGLFQG